MVPLIIQQMRMKNEKYGYEKSISNKALDLLKSYEWPGNVRQLENVIERIMVTAADNIIKAEDLPDFLHQKLVEIKTDGSKSFKELTGEYEKQILSRFIEKGFTPKEMAKLLSMDVTNIRRKLHKYQIDFKST